MPNRFEVISQPNKFRLKPSIWVEPEAATTTEGFDATTTEWPVDATTTEWPVATTTDDGIIQYVTYYDGITEWRKGVRDGYFVWDRAITLTGFDGIEDTDWENVRMLGGVATTTGA
jgi:hypothetical protein